MIGFGESEARRTEGSHGRRRCQSAPHPPTGIHANVGLGFDAAAARPRERWCCR